MAKPLALLWLSLASCTAHDYQPFLSRELGFVQLGVQLASEEKEVRRVLAQRGLRVVSRLDNPAFVALGAATRDGQKSAVRLVSRRGVVVAEDASEDDLFGPGRVSLIEHFGGSLGEYLLVAHARVARGHEVGCVVLDRVLPDGSVVQCPLDVSPFGSRACISNLAPGHAGHMQATVAWPGLQALTTPELEVELAFIEPPVGREPAQIPVAHVVPGAWIDSQTTRLSTLRLARADFSRRHAAGVARAAIALLTGHDVATQVNAYRNALGSVLPATAEAAIAADTASHIERGWLDSAPATPAPDESQPTSSTSKDEAPNLATGDVIVAPPRPPEAPNAQDSIDEPGDSQIIEPEVASPAPGRP